MKKTLIDKKGLVADKSKVLVFYYAENGKRTCLTGLFKEVTEESITILNKYKTVTFKLEDVVGVQQVDPRRS